MAILKTHADAQQSLFNTSSVNGWAQEVIHRNTVRHDCTRLTGSKIITLETRNLIPTLGTAPLGNPGILILEWYALDLADQLDGV
jgi:hypothetical protein